MKVTLLFKPRSVVIRRSFELVFTLFWWVDPTLQIKIQRPIGTNIFPHSSPCLATPTLWAHEFDGRQQQQRPCDRTSESTQATDGNCTWTHLLQDISRNYRKFHGKIDSQNVWKFRVSQTWIQFSTIPQPDVHHVWFQEFGHLQVGSLCDKVTDAVTVVIRNGAFVQICKYMPISQLLPETQLTLKAGLLLPLLQETSRHQNQGLSLLGTLQGTIKQKWQRLQTSAKTCRNSVVRCRNHCTSTNREDMSGLYQKPPMPRWPLSFPSCSARKSLKSSGKILWRSSAHLRGSDGTNMISQKPTSGDVDADRCWSMLIDADRCSWFSTFWRLVFLSSKPFGLKARCTRATPRQPTALQHKTLVFEHLDISEFGEVSLD